MSFVLFWATPSSTWHAPGSALGTMRCWELNLVLLEASHVLSPLSFILPAGLGWIPAHTL